MERCPRRGKGLSKLSMPNLFTLPGPDATRSLRADLVNSYASFNTQFDVILEMFPQDPKELVAHLLWPQSNLSLSCLHHGTGCPASKLLECSLLLQELRFLEGQNLVCFIPNTQQSPKLVPSECFQIDRHRQTTMGGCLVRWAVPSCDCGQKDADST